MVLQNNINFESFDPQNKFDISKTFDTKFFLGSIKKIKKDFGKIKNTELKAGLRNFFSWFKSYH